MSKLSHGVEPFYQFNFKNMTKKLNGSEKVSAEETTFSRKLDLLEDLRVILVTTTFSLSDLIDDLTGYSKVNGKRNQ